MSSQIKIVHSESPTNPDEQNSVELIISKAESSEVKNAEKPTTDKLRAKGMAFGIACSLCYSLTQPVVKIIHE